VTPASRTRQEVLRELGISDEDLNRMKATGVY
jgi:hypothetical protein